MSRLDEQLLAAHAAADTRQLVRLYTQAADACSDEDAAGFYLTHAYVFALEVAAPQTEALRGRLVAMGRETPLSR